METFDKSSVLPDKQPVGQEKPWLMGWFLLSGRQ